MELVDKIEASLHSITITKEAADCLKRLVSLLGLPNNDRKRIDRLYDEHTESIG